MPSRFELDQERGLLFYTDGIDNGATIKVLDIKTNSIVLTVSPLSGSQVLAFALDTEKHLVYAAGSTSSVSIKKFDYLESNPTFTSVHSSTTDGAILYDLAVDQREGNGRTKKLYYTLGRNLYEVDLASPAGRTPVFDVPSVADLGRMAIDYNENKIYVYSLADSAGATVYRGSIPATGNGHELMFQLTSINSTANDVDLFYHPHINSGDGRIYLSFNNPGSGDGIKYFNTNMSPGCFISCLQESGLASADPSIQGISFITSCDNTRSLDSNLDGEPDCLVEGAGGGDQCPEDPNKTEPGVCGCGTPDTDSDKDGTPDCNDSCSSDPLKTEPGTCGCGTPDADSDNDGTLDCQDSCASDPAKIAPGTCGCGVSDIDSDLDGTANCNDLCVNDPLKSTEGICGCGIADSYLDRFGNISCELSCREDSDTDGL